MVAATTPLTLESVTVQKRGKRLIGPITHTFDGDGISIIIGPTGAGKTTLLKLLHGLERPRDGMIIRAAGNSEIPLKHSFVFQTPILLRRSVLENLIYPLRLQKVPKPKARSAALTWLEHINLHQSAKLEAAWLSGGEKQKLAIVRALIVEPETIFLDEPTNNLDGKATREIEQLLRDANKGGTRIIMATHDLGQARRLANEVLFIRNGIVHETGPAKTFFSKPQTEEAQAFLKGEIVE